MNPILQALNAGSDAEDVISFLSHHFPKLRKKIAYAAQSGASLEGILNHLSTLDKKKFHQVANSDLSPQDEKTITRGSGRRLTLAEQASYIEAKKEEEFKNKVGKVAGGIALAGAGIAGGMALRSALTRGIMPSEILPAQRAIGYSPRQAIGYQPKQIGHVSPRGLPAPSAPGISKPGMAPNVPSASPTIPTTPIVPEVAKQTVSPAVQTAQKLNLTPHIQSLLKNYKEPAQIAAILYNQFPKEMQQLQKEAGVPMEQAVAEVLQTMPQQEEQKIQPEKQQIKPQPEQIPRQEAITQEQKIQSKEKIQGAVFGQEIPKKLSEAKPLSERSFAIPTYKFPSESHEEFKNREIINSAIEKAAKALEENKSFLDFPDPWGKPEVTYKTISRGPRKGEIEKTVKEERFVRSVASDVLRFLAGTPNVFDPLLDDEEKEELNNAFEEQGMKHVKAALPSGDGNIHDVLKTPNMVWNLLLSVEPRLQNVEIPKSVKGYPKLPGGKMGTTELRRNLTHAVYGALSGKKITTKLKDKIGKISSVANSLDMMAEAERQGKMNDIIKEQEQLLENDEYFFSLFTDEIEELGKKYR